MTITVDIRPAQAELARLAAAPGRAVVERPLSPIQLTTPG